MEATTAEIIDAQKQQLLAVFNLVLTRREEFDNDVVVYLVANIPKHYGFYSVSG